ncbi:uncharacterized protein LOC123529896 isoform X2 [Mercenaria mercenaria]|uniref:uncharacterized protein LOC123529896 isoform X2 n=1 Tax=Mercenaria mercenaria TaxID=6596 RepID=UPI00234F7AA4|nr:uncharacterized protein LOC123529896 isoform X2 [Mercenaria mercenaria]
MPKSKLKSNTNIEQDQDDESSAVKRARVEGTDTLQMGVPTDIKSQTSRLFHEELAIGSCVRPINTKYCGTVGPFLKIKETGELCFLTVRHIFGPFRSPKIFFGTKVFQIISLKEEKKEWECGCVVAAEYSESLDVALVKVSETCVSPRIKFVHVTDEHLRDSGLYSANFPPYNNTHTTVDARKLTPNEIETHQLIKFSKVTGLTVGKFHLCDGRVKTDTYTVRRDEPNYTLTEILTYKNQFRVISVGNGTFAKDTDVGAAVYLVGETKCLRCVGIVSRIMEDKREVLVTPIDDILTGLQQQLGQTLEVVTSHSNNQKISSDNEDHFLYSRALSEGQEHDRHLRVNIIGFYAQGKTTLTRRLLNEPVKEVESTDGIDVHIRRCKIKEKNWERFDTKQEFDELSCRLVSIAKSVAENSDSIQDTEDNEELDLTTGFKEQVLIEDGERRLRTTTSYNRKTVQTDAPAEPSTSVKCVPLFRHFSDDLSENKTISDNELIATIWDFGGQFVYYATHQIFHSRDAVYLLVFDLRKGLDNVLEDYDFPDRQEKMKTSLMFWVNSINAFVGSDDGTKPKIILVGTHKDKFTGDIEAKFKEVKELFAGTDVRNHIFDHTFAVANTDMSDDVIDELRETIYQIGVETASCRLIPAKWIPLELSLLEVRHKNIITFNEVIEMDAENDHPIRDENQIKEFLKYHHEKGTLVFFDEEELNKHVILNPQFLIDAFRCIITSKTICDGSSKLFLLWKKMTNMAVLENEILDAVWSKERNIDFFRCSSILLNFLKRHRILAELQTDDSSDKLVGMGKYMIPSFLKSNCSNETSDEFLCKKTYSSVLLGICLENITVLATVYERITAAALGRWPPIKFEDQYLVFQNVGYYRLDRQHAGRITQKEGKGIELMVIVLCPSGEDINVVSDRFRRYVEMVISQEFKKLHNNTREKVYSHYIKCNHADHCGRGSKESHSLDNIKKEIKVCCPDYRDHPIDVRRTIEEWFQEKKIPDEQASSVRPVTEMDLNKIAQAIGTNWELLGIALGLSADKVDRIKQRSRDCGIATIIFYMLKEWKNQNQHNADMNVLIQTMKDTDVLSVNWDKIRNFLDNF